MPTCSRSIFRSGKLDLGQLARRRANGHRRGARRRPAARSGQAPGRRDAAQRRRAAGLRAARHRAAGARAPAGRSWVIRCIRLAFGQSRGLGQARDVALKDLSVNQTVYVKNELTVHGTARIDGFAGQAIPVQLLFESAAERWNRSAARSSRRGRAARRCRSILRTVPQTPGEYKVTLRVPKQPGELVTTNNEMSTFVTVLKGGVNVLYLEGALRVDQKFLRRSLDASPDIKVDYVRLDARDPAAAAGRLDRAVSPRQVRRVHAGRRRFVGLHARGTAGAGRRREARAPGWRCSADFTPSDPAAIKTRRWPRCCRWRWTHRERQRPGDPIRTDVQLPGPLKMRPAKPLGERHYLMALGDGGRPRQPLGKAAAARRRQPAWARPSPARKCWPKRPTANRCWSSQEAGGRVMAFAGDSTWHWWMEGFEAAAQAILAAGDPVARAQGRADRRQRVDQAGRAALWAAPARRVHGRRTFAPGRSAAPTRNSRPKSRCPTGRNAKINLVRQGDHVSGVFDETQAAGDYTISVTARTQNAPVGNAALAIPGLRAGPGARQRRGRSHAVGQPVGHDQRRRRPVAGARGAARPAADACKRSRSRWKSKRRSSTRPGTPGRSSCCSSA